MVARFSNYYMETIDLCDRVPNLISSSKYVIGRQKYASMPLAHVTVGPLTEGRPIISCPTVRIY